MEDVIHFSHYFPRLRLVLTTRFITGSSKRKLNEFHIFPAPIQTTHQTYLPCTVRWALERALPMVIFTIPLMLELVLQNLSLWMCPTLSICTCKPGCSSSPLRLHWGVKSGGADISHSNWASKGAITSTFFRGWTTWIPSAATEENSKKF